MKREILFAGDELELLNALDRAGCVLGDNSKFHCDMENDKLPFNSRLPIRITGEYIRQETGWKIGFRAVPARKTLMVGLFCLVALICFALTGGSITAMALFAIILAALVINFLAQKKGCLQRFESVLLHGVQT